jgi:hypothetical protein
VQGVVQAGHHANRITEGRVSGDILNAFAVNPNFAPIAQAFDVFLRREWLRACRRARLVGLSLLIG